MTHEPDLTLSREDLYEWARYRWCFCHQKTSANYPPSSGMRTRWMRSSVVGWECFMWTAPLYRWAMLRALSGVPPASLDPGPGIAEDACALGAG